MKKNKAHYKEKAILALGEIIVSGLVVLGFFISDLIFDTGFTYRVFTGVLLGSLVTVLNFFGLSRAVNRSVDGFIALRGNAELTEEEVMRFTAEHSMKIQNAIKISFLVRIFTMLAALVVAFVLDWFSPLATAIPLIAYRPILVMGEAVRRKFDKAPNPENYIVYNEDFEVKDDEGDGSLAIAESCPNEEKESDE